MKRSALLLSALIGVFVAGCGGGEDVFGPAEPPAEGYLLRLNVGEDSSVQYTMTMSMRVQRLIEIPPAEEETEGEESEAQGPEFVETVITLTMDYDLSVTGIEDGKITWETVVSDSTVVMDPPEPDGPDLTGEKVTTVTDERGSEISKTGGDQFSGMIAPGTGTPGVSGIVFPEEKVKVGDTWEQEYTLGFMLLKVRYTLKGVEKVGEVNAVLITAEIVENPSVTIEEPMRILIHPVTGEVLLSEGKVTMTTSAFIVNLESKLEKK
ncbi:MAG: hypothetical protein IH851_12280 [Armatimonadetes bacterium]|nr:hypothetical protein [Armatimonadota bacterium]